MMKKVLVCDDDPGVSEVIKIILEEAGYRVVTLNNGHGIQKKLAALKPDVVLLDIWMPGISGKEVIMLLKRNKEIAHIPVVVISALSNTDKIAKESGADDYLPKPFDTTDLISMVKKHAGT